MLIARRCESGADARQMVASLLEPLDRNRRSSLGECEICGEVTRLRARLGRKTKFFVLFRKHQSISGLQTLLHHRPARELARPRATAALPARRVILPS